jgi:hypothetical protein
VQIGVVLCAGRDPSDDPPVWNFTGHLAKEDAYVLKL